MDFSEYLQLDSMAPFFLRHHVHVARHNDDSANVTDAS